MSEYLFTDFDRDGNLVIRASSQTALYALKYFEQQRRNKKARIIIEGGKTFSLEDLTLIIGKDIAAWQKWQSMEDGKVIVPELQDTPC